MKQKMKTKYIVGVISIIAAAALVYYFVKKNNDKESSEDVKDKESSEDVKVRASQAVTVRPSQEVEEQMQNSFAVNI